MRQAAKHDLHTTEGLAQVQHLRFVLPSGEVDTQFNGMTIRGGVLDDGIREMPGSEIIDGRCALQLPRLAAGCHWYDVLVSGDGTDNPLLAGVIHVAPRVTPVDVDDNAPADYLDIVIPEDEGGTVTVISESPVWVDDAVEKSLQERGMYVTPVDGETVLTMSAGTNTRDFNYFTFALNSTYVSGHLAGSYRLNKIALRTPTSEANGTRWMARLCRYSAGLALPLEVLGTSTSTASWTSINASTMECHWNFDGIAVSAADRLVLEVYAVDSSGAPVSKALIAYGTAAAHGGTEGVLIVSGDKLAWRNYSRLALSLSVAYDDSVSVGGIELASRRHFDVLAASVAETGKQIADDADAAQQAREEAEQIASGMTLTAGTITTGAPGSQAAAELKPGSTAGSYTLDMTIPRGDVGTVDTSQAYTWTQPQTYDATINAYGGVDIPLATGAPTATAAVNRIHSAGMAIVDEMFRVRFYLGASTATNNAVISAPVANQVLQVYLQGGMTTTAHVNLVPGILAYNNYSNFAGVVLPVRLVSASKITFAMGKVAVTARDDLPLDAYTLVPASQGLAFGEILDVTFTPDRDAAAGGYHVRTREIYWSESTGKWMVKTTQSLLALNDNVVIPGCAARVVYQQYTEGMIDTDERGALWLIVTGGTPHACQKIATVRGVHNYESFGLRDYYLNITNPASWPITVVVEAATVMTSWDNGQNPAYYGFKAIETNAIQSETVEEFPVE